MRLELLATSDEVDGKVRAAAVSAGAPSQIAVLDYVELMMLVDVVLED